VITVSYEFTPAGLKFVFHVACDVEGDWLADTTDLTTAVEVDRAHRLASEKQGLIEGGSESDGDEADGGEDGVMTRSPSRALRPAVSPPVPRLTVPPDWRAFA